MMKKIIVLTGAGVSAESGIKTFREYDGLWENYKIEEVATPEAWNRDRKLVLDFYNMRRKQLYEVEPNAAHFALAKLEEKYDVQIITQNIDDLHERGGSTKILHLHGELKKVRSTADPSLIYELEGGELKEGDKCEKGSQLRPHIVWFGEEVPNIIPAARLTSEADICIIIGTSMVVYPAAGLVNNVPMANPIFYIDPQPNPVSGLTNFTPIQKKAGEGVPELVEELLNIGQ